MRTQAVKDSARLLLSPTIGNRLLSVINRLGSSTYHRYIICDSNQYRTAQHRGRAQHHGQLAKSGGTPTPVLTLRQELGQSGQAAVIWRDVGLPRPHTAVHIFFNMIILYSFIFMLNVYIYLMNIYVNYQFI